VTSREPLQNVSRAAAKLRRAVEREATVRAEFEEAIREANRAGYSVRKIASAAGISYTRVQQIVRG
jgi:hypothetical protein